MNPSNNDYWVRIPRNSLELDGNPRESLWIRTGRPAAGRKLLEDEEVLGNPTKSSEFPRKPTVVSDQLASLSTGLKRVR